jgi:hypothetical protein
MAFRASRTRELLAKTSMPSSAKVLQEGKRISDAAIAATSH